MSFDRFPTMQEIADQAGVSRMAVSLALRNSPKISATTAGRIQAIAERLGYRPNPLVWALMTQLRDRKKVRKPSTIAYVTAYPTASGWREPGPFLEFFKGARKRAEALGDAGFAQLALTNEERKTAGVNQNSELVGAASIDLIDAQLRRNERGVPQFSKTLLIQGHWVPGPTVRSLDPPASSRRRKMARAATRARC